MYSFNGYLYTNCGRQMREEEEEEKYLFADWIRRASN